MDIVSEEKRSYIMSKVPQKQSKQELLVCKFLYSNGYRYRKNLKSLPGSPDIAFTKYKIAIFIHGCFWHGHNNCKKATLPTTNITFWKQKIEKNRLRDKRVKQILRKSGWRVITIWECKLKNKKVVDKSMNKLISQLNFHAYDC